MPHDAVLLLDAGERMQLLRALLWSLLAWSEEARRGDARRIEAHFAECDRLEGAIVDVVAHAGVVGVPVTLASASCLRAVADTCAEATGHAVGSLSIDIHDMARRSHALFVGVSM